MSPTIVVPMVHPHPQSHPMYAACPTSTASSISSVSTVSYHAAHCFPAGAHRSHRHSHMRASSLSPLIAGRSQADFLLSAPHCVAHRISCVLRCPVRCVSLPMSRQVRRHQVAVLLRRPCRRPELHLRASRYTVWSSRSPTVRH
jgi:hypothetical protein